MNDDWEITGLVMGALVEVHRRVGPGLLESAYEVCVAEELRHRSIRFVAQAPVSFRYREALIERAFFADLVIEERVVVELKAVEQLLPVHVAQTLTYLKLLQLDVALLVNFHVERLNRGGVRRLLRPTETRASSD